MIRERRMEDGWFIVNNLSWLCILVRNTTMTVGWQPIWAIGYLACYRVCGSETSSFVSSPLFQCALFAVCGSLVRNFCLHVDRTPLISKYINSSNAILGPSRHSGRWLSCELQYFTVKFLHNFISKICAGSLANFRIGQQLSSKIHDNYQERLWTRDYREMEAFAKCRLWTTDFEAEPQKGNSSHH